MPISRCHVSPRSPHRPVLVFEPLLRSCAWCLAQTTSIPPWSAPLSPHRRRRAQARGCSFLTTSYTVGQCDFWQKFSMELHISLMIQVILRLDDASLTRMSCSLLYCSHRSQDSTSSLLQPSTTAQKKCGSYFPSRSSFSVSHDTVLPCLSRSVSACS